MALKKNNNFIKTIIQPKILLTILSVIFILISLYHFIFAPVTFDEINYLIKGKAFVTGQNQPYKDYSFYTDYPPFSYWLVGWTQVIGTNIVLPRLVSLLLTAAIWFLTIRICYKIGGEKLAIISAILMVASINLSKIFIQLPPYPQATFLIMLSILMLIHSKNKFTHLATLFLLALASFIRLQAFLIYFTVVVFLMIQKKSQLDRILIAIFAVLLPVVFTIPFYPGILKLLNQIPTFGLISPAVNGIYSLKLSIFYQDINLAKRVFSLYRFFVFYLPFIFLSIFLVILVLVNKKLQIAKLKNYLGKFTIQSLIIYIILINLFVVITTSFFSLCPACSITYLNLVLPLIVIILSWGIISTYNIMTTKESKTIFKIILLFAIFWLFLPTPYHQLDLPYLPPVFMHVSQTGKQLGDLIPKNEAIFALGGQQYWYFAKLKTFPPLVNGLYTFRDSRETDKLLKYGYWNMEAALEWAKEANWALVDERFIDDLKRGGDHTKDLVKELETILEKNFYPQTRIAGQSGEKIQIYSRQPKVQD